MPLDDAALASEAAETATRLGVSTDMLRKAKAAFEAADVDKSGAVDLPELFDLLDSLNAAPLSESDRAGIKRRFGFTDTSIVPFPVFLEVFCSTAHYRCKNVEVMLKALLEKSHREIDDSNKTLDFRVRFAGIPVKHIKAYVRAEINEMSACMRLPIVFLLLISFTAAVSFHERIDVMYGQKQALIFDLEENAVFAYGQDVPLENGRIGHKNLYDVNTFADFWSWMSLGLVPLLWDEGWPISESRTNVKQHCSSPQEHIRDFAWNASFVSGSLAQPLITGPCPVSDSSPDIVKEWYGEPRSPTHMWFNAVVAGIRLEQERAEIRPCPRENSYGKHLYTGACVDPTAEWLKPTDTSSVIARENSRTNQPHGETVFLLSGQTRQEVRQQLHSLEDKAWFSPLTRKITLLITTYNPHLNLMLATHVVIYVNSVGHFWRLIQPTCIWLEPYHGWWCFVADALWIGCILNIVAEKLREFKHNYTQHQMCGALKTLLSLDGIVDLFNIVVCAAVATLWVRYLMKLEELKSLLSHAQVGVPGSWDDADRRTAYFNLIQDLCEESLKRKDLLFVYPFALVSRFFEVCTGQPRLALVTKTIKNAAVDVFHFGCVFLFVFSIFSVAGMILFGDTVADFATLSNSLDTSFHVILGDLDWEQLKTTGRARAAIWFWGFIWLGDLILFNMLLAIIMDVYTESRGALLSSDETLWSQVVEIYTRWRRTRAGLRVTMPYILDHLDLDTTPKSPRKMPSLFQILDVQEEPEENFNVKQLMLKVPGLPEDQAVRILQDSWSSYERRERAKHSQTMAEALLSIKHIEGRLVSNSSILENLIRISDLNTETMLKAMASGGSKAPTGSTSQYPDQSTIQEELQLHQVFDTLNNPKVDDAVECEQMPPPTGSHVVVPMHPISSV